ncbi:hypothetical protein [Enterococcus sp. 5B3_DIV0040]|uniref:hypothetical protein n=1 Tax=Enterococcus sp. 5B3_DIV0040 TaxID=1834182 RepID=UPI000A35622D|nr:hypothetical protein [Enterococcus sp. 5B3_DIV0040]OTO01269.1 hypothetical protein A5883_003586 [Enterococcus sp. 5B3_DIV0040]
MTHVAKETKKDRLKIDLLRYLCQKQPELLIIELSELIEAPIEKTFIWIKAYDLPYHWKYKHGRNGKQMSREEKIMCILQNSGLTYEKLEGLSTEQLDNLIQTYEEHKNCL